MRKRFWTFWSLLVIVLAISYAWPLDYDLQLTKTVWVQGVVTDGGVRFILIKGDSSASALAGIVFEREKATWRNVFYTARWGKAVHYSGAVDEPGTILDTYRVDIPMLFLLLAIAFILLAGPYVRKRIPPWRLIWEEFWNPRRNETVLNRLFRRSQIVVSLMMLCSVSIIWISGYFGLSYQWGNFRDPYAFIAKYMEDPNYEPVVELKTGLALVFPKIVFSRGKQMLQDGRFGIEITNSRLNIHYLTDATVQGVNTFPTNHSFAGFKYEEFVSFPSGFNILTAGTGIPATGMTNCTKVSAPLGMILLLLGLWPATMFFRGPVRRADRRAKGLCINCGYNLRGLVQPRCPECGSDFDPDILLDAA